jgi:hypothetical protein
MKVIKKIIGEVVIFMIGMVSPLPAFTQDNDSIVPQFERYNSQGLQEKIFVHTDKSFYLVGEIVWFKVYVTDAVFNKPLDVSKISYIEIINRDSKAVLQAKIGMSSGSGSGSFLLPSFLSTGHYTVKAYTNWMKNFHRNITFRRISAL